MSKIDLLKHTVEVTRIDCSSCNKVETVQDAAEQAIDELHKKGWKVKGKDVLCPSCAKPNADLPTAANFTNKGSVIKRDMENRINAIKNGR